MGIPNKTKGKTHILEGPKMQSGTTLIFPEWENVRSGTSPKPTEHLQFNKTPTEVTYSKLTNSKKPNKGGQHLGKKTKGDQHLGGKIPEGDLQKVFY